MAGVGEGEILAGKYRVERILGMGGMGLVVAARHIELDSRVAIKFLLPALLSNQEAVGRFAREARSAVKIQNEHVARVLDVGTLDNGAPYMVMEFLEGEDLSIWLRERGTLTIEQAVEFVLQACVAVADAHGLGIIHRDLKPANLFCIRRSDGRFVIKVLDFGISKLMDVGRSSEPPGMSVTKTSAVMGSPLYMSPEQVQSAKDVDARTDLWALGVVLFELLTGTVPFPGEAFGEVAVKIAIQKPASLLAYRPDAPPGLEAVIHQCLEKDRRRRYANVAELALALLPFAPKGASGLVERITGIIQAAGLSASASVLPPSPHARQETLLEPQNPGTVASWSGPPGITAGKKAIVWALAMTGVVGVVGGFALLRRISKDPSLKERGSAPLTSVALDAETLTPLGAPLECAPNSTRCSGTALVACKTGQWVEGSVTAGQCGAVCTPGSSPPRCSGPLGVQACGSNGQWATAVLCDKSNRCRDGACVPSTSQGAFTPLPAKRDPGPPARTTTTAPQPKPDCDPPYTVDEQGKHFKPECYR